MPKPAVRSTKTKKSSGLKNRFSSLKKTNKLLALLFVLATVVVGILIIVRAFAATAQGTYSWWLWSAPKGGFYSMENRITVQANESTARYFWSHQSFFNNGGPTYMGLQSNGSRVIDHSVGKTAVFSIFDSAVNATPGNCKMQKDGFDGYVGRSGSSCIIAYDWIMGRTYKVKTVISGADSKGTWWTGSVTDTVTGIETLIGKIQVPTTWQGLGDQSVMWTENFYDTASTCSTVPYTRVLFGDPVANGNISPNKLTNTLSDKSYCQGNSGSKLTRVTGGVIQEAGLVVSAPKTITDLSGLVTADSKFATCEQKVTKTNGTTGCAIDLAHPKFTLGSLANSTSKYSNFCFKGVRADNNLASIRITVGNIGTGLSRSTTKTISDGSVFSDACVSAVGIFTNSTNYNYATVTALTGTILIYGGLPQ